MRLLGEQQTDYGPMTAVDAPHQERLRARLERELEFLEVRALKVQEVLRLLDQHPELEKMHDALSVLSI